MYKLANTIDSVHAAANQDFRAAASKVRLQLESADNKDTVRVIVEKATGVEDKNIVYRYEWFVNGQNAGDGSDALNGFRRGDKISVKVTPFDGEKPGEPRTLTMDVKNSTPRISAIKETTFDGKVLSGQIDASDPDGDVLSYELMSGPEGMVIDKRTGAVTWAKDNMNGEHSIKVKVTDGYGGITEGQFTLTIPKEATISPAVQRPQL